MNPSFDSELRRVIVVDPKPEDYADMAATLDAEKFRLQFATSGHDALQGDKGSRTAMWLISTSLHDMSGLDLLETVRRRRSAAVIFLIGNSYCKLEEVAARAAGATTYFCKPPRVAWLESWRNEPRGSCEPDSMRRRLKRLGGLQSLDFQ